MKLTILISLKLFCILIFEKTFVRANSNEIKVHIKWRHLPGMQDLVKLSEWTERFKLKLFRLSYEADPYFGRAIEPPIANGKTGRYDFAKLTIRPQSPQIQQIGIQNVEGKGKELAESSSSSKRMEKDLFELQIKIISPANLNIQQTIVKRLQKLPNVNEIIVCSFQFHTNMACYNTKYYGHMYMQRPDRNIFFEVLGPEKLKIKKIECTKMKGLFLPPKDPFKKLNRKVNVMEYDGPICPSDEYTIHYFIGTRENKSTNYSKFDFKCDEAFYEYQINHYQLSISDSKCKLKLIENNIEKGKGQQFGQHCHQPRPIHQPISSELLRNALHAAAQNAQQIEVAQPNPQHSQPAAGANATMPSDHSDLRNTKSEDFWSSLPPQSLNLIRRMIAIGEIDPNILPTNYHPSQIVGISGLTQRQYLRQHSDLGPSSSQGQGSGHADISGQHQRQHLPQHIDHVQNNEPHASPSQKHENVQQIQPSGMQIKHEPIKIEMQSHHELTSMQGHPPIDFELLTTPGSSTIHTKPLLDIVGNSLSSNLQMVKQEKEDNEEKDTILGLGLSGHKRGPNERDGKGNDGEGPSAGQKETKKAKKE